jgi:hypothetical protein
LQAQVITRSSTIWTSHHASYAPLEWCDSLRLLHKHAGNSFELDATTAKMGANYYTGTLDSSTVLVIVISALVLYNGLELLLLVFTTFTSFSGLYFWSLFVATSGLIPYAVGWLLNYFRVSQLTGLILNNIGWWTVVTGQSVVLWVFCHTMFQAGS